MTDLSQAFCYWPNGTIAQNTTSGEYALPCDTGKGVSSCCLPGQQCNTQFRCLDVVGNFAQASCTQKDFNNYNCPCPNQVVGRDRMNPSFTPSPSLTSDVLPWLMQYSITATTGCVDGTVCCGVRNSSCCANGQGRLSIFFDYYSAIPTATSDIASYISGYTPSTAATNTAFSASKSGTAAQASTTGNDATSIPTSTSSADSKSDSSAGLSGGAKAGIGIGIALIVLAIALAVSWFVIRNRNQRRKPNINGLRTQPQRLDGNGYEGDTWSRHEVEGDAHHPHQTAIEMEQQNGNLGLVVPISATDTSPNSPSKSELEAYSPYFNSPGENKWRQPERQVNELEQPQARPTELEQPSRSLNKRATLRHELE